MLKTCVRLTVQIITIHAPWRPELSQSIIILRPSVRTNLPCGKYADTLTKTEHFFSMPAHDLVQSPPR